MSTAAAPSDRTPSSTAPIDAEVLVVGAGPVGVTLAGLLARRGVDVTVIDTEHRIFPLPRAAHIDDEAMRIVAELGCGPALADTLRPNTGMDLLAADHSVLVHLAAEPGTPLGWPRSAFMFQPSFEQTLRRAALDRGASFRLGVGLGDLRQDAHGVTGELSDGTSVAARYLIGCDGARSTVRRIMGATQHDLDFEEPWLVVDLVLEDPVAGLPERALQVCDPRRPHTLVPMPEPRFRFEFMLLAGEDPDELQRDDSVAALISPWMDPRSATVERRAVYTFHGLITERWRDGRVLLAGDAAHQMPPFLGQGMCSGMRDAANLAWKLDAVLAGAPDALLDTYQAEREPHVRAIVQAAIDYGRIICTTDVDEATERDRAMLAEASERRDGALPHDARPENTTPFPVLRGELFGPGGGRLAVQPTLADGRLLDDAVGPCWSVVAGRRAMLEAPVIDAWARMGAVLMDAEAEPALVTLLDDAGGDLVVVRPDRHIHTSLRDAADLTAPPDLVTPHLTVS